MKKHKKKLVCLGWGIVMYPQDIRPYLFYGLSGWGTRKEAIEHYDKEGYAHYQYDRKRHRAIAKQLWVEVKHG